MSTTLPEPIVGGPPAKSMMRAAQLPAGKHPAIMPAATCSREGQSNTRTHCASHKPSAGTVTCEVQDSEQSDRLLTAGEQKQSARPLIQACMHAVMLLFGYLCACVTRALTFAALNLIMSVANRQCVDQSTAALASVTSLLTNH